MKKIKSLIVTLGLPGLIIGISLIQVFAATAPTDIKLDGGDAESINENRPIGSHFSTLTTIDADANESYTYSLVAGPGDTDNDSFAISLDSLRTNTVLDFETKSSYSIRIQQTMAMVEPIQKHLLSVLLIFQSK